MQFCYCSREYCSYFCTDVYPAQQRWVDCLHRGTVHQWALLPPLLPQSQEEHREPSEILCKQSTAYGRACSSQLAKRDADRQPQGGPRNAVVNQRRITLLPL